MKERAPCIVSMDSGVYLGGAGLMEVGNCKAHTGGCSFVERKPYSAGLRVDLTPRLLRNL